MHSKRGQALVCPAALALVDEPGLLLEAAEGELAVSHIAQGLEPVRKAGKIAVKGVNYLLYALIVQLYYAVMELLCAVGELLYAVYELPAWSPASF